MAKDKISDYSSTANSNTDIAGINIDEGCAPSGINDAIRTLMAQLKTWQSGGQDVYIHPAGSASAPSITANGDTNTGIFFPAADTVGISTGGSERARVDSSGNLGLGVTPSAWGSGKAIEVGYNGNAVWSYSQTDSYLTHNARFTDAWRYVSSAAASTYRQSGGVHYWNTAASGTAGNAITFTQAMTLDASGNLGIGLTSTGGARLAVQGSSSSGYLTVGDGTSTMLMGAGSALSSDSAVPYLRSNGAIGFATGGGTERARFDSSGNLLVGGTSTNESFAGVPSIQGATNCIFTNRRNSTSSSSQFRFYNPNGVVGQIETSGSSTSYATSSDYRLKENIAPMTGALEKVAQLKPCTYTWKADGSDGQGFIAHELQAVLPDAVSGEKDAVNEDGSIKPQGIDTSFLVATLTAAIQEQQALITSLTARITALEQ